MRSNRWSAMRGAGSRSFLTRSSNCRSTKASCWQGSSQGDGAAGGCHDDRLLAADRGASDHCSSLAGQGREACRGDAQSALHSARNARRRCSWRCKASQGLMDGAAQAELARRVRIQIAEVALPPRRSRTCQRKVCRLMDKWPRMMPPSASSLPQIFCRHDDCLHQAQLKMGLHERRVQHGGYILAVSGPKFRTWIIAGVQKGVPFLECQKLRAGLNGSQALFTAAAPRSLFNGGWYWRHQDKAIHKKSPQSPTPSSTTKKPPCSSAARRF